MKKTVTVKRPTFEAEEDKKILREPPLDKESLSKSVQEYTKLFEGINEEKK